MVYNIVSDMNAQQEASLNLFHCTKDPKSNKAKIARRKELSEFMSHLGMGQ